jgi:Uncharacterised ArCR, COG2043
MNYPTLLIESINLNIPLLGLYDAPYSKSFEPLVIPKNERRTCTYQFYKQWKNGSTLLLTKANYGCGGCGHWFFGLENRTRNQYIDFLANDEGLKANEEIMGLWFDYEKTYQPENENIFIGPLKKEMYDYLRTITFFVNPDQLSVMALAANYFAKPTDPNPVIAQFGSGCMEMLTLIEKDKFPQAIIGSTDLAMRQNLPRNIIAFTVNKLMYENFCKLDEKSFLTKPFLQRLKAARGGTLNVE